MSWRRWKLALLIATLTGVFGGGIVAFIDPNISWKSITFILIYNICQNALLFLKDHPVDAINFNDTTIVQKKDVS